MWKLRPRELKFLSRVTEVNGEAGTRLAGPPVLRRPSLHEAPGQPSSPSPGQGSQGQTLISSRAKFQMQASPAGSGRTIDGVLMTSGFTDKLRAGPGCCGPIVSRDGNQTPRPLGSRRRRRGARRGAWGLLTLGQPQNQEYLSGESRFPGSSRISGRPSRCRGCPESPPRRI